MLRMIKTIKRDIALIRESDPAARNAVEILLTYPTYRLAHWFYVRNY